MKSLAVKLGFFLLVLGLTVCCTEAWSADWKELAEASTGVFQYDAASISSSAQGFVKVWIHNASKRETSLVEFNCKDGIYRVLDVTEYDEAGRIKTRQDYYDNPYWLSVPPKSVPESLQKVICR